MWLRRLPVCEKAQMSTAFLPLTGGPVLQDDFRRDLSEQDSREVHRRDVAAGKIMQLPPGQRATEVAREEEVCQLYNEMRARQVEAHNHRLADLSSRSSA